QTAKLLAAEQTRADSVEGVKDGIRSGFLNIDEYMRNFSDLRQGLDRSGSTAVCVLLSPTHLYFINCGDSRAVLSRDGKVGFSTQDHKPCNPREKERIQNAGGSVMIQRVNGSLAVSRALGDYDYKCVDGKGPTEQLVSPEPEVCVLERAAEGDEFVVLACDGIWDVMSNEELCEFVRSRLLPNKIMAKSVDMLSFSLNNADSNYVLIMKLRFLR
uniref:Protein phosphatase, Mg2+/Mn2+ dependent, 1Bb n=1 Tax=Oryzias sinensis TaxID=183150 RepID=A0A8C7YGN8_9TELE